MKILPQSFFNCPTLCVAQDLLGCFLVRKFPDRIQKFKIVETEGYNGLQDLASHASHGRTKRNEVMFGRPGIIYIYFTYGMHYMLNIVTGAKNYPAAILIRAVEPYINRKSPPKADQCLARRQAPLEEKSKNQKFFTNGPAKLTKELYIDKKFNGLPIYTKKHGLWIEGRNEESEKLQIVKTKRIGVDYAGSYKNKPWRFYIKDNIFVSRKK